MAEQPDEELERMSKERDYRPEDAEADDARAAAKARQEEIEERLADKLEELGELKAATFDTDAIVDVFDHLARDSKTWKELIAQHGLDPEKAVRALGAIGLDEKGGDVTIAVKAMTLGLRFGQMRLEPVEWVRPDNCGCFMCVLRRQAEAQAAEAEGDEPQGGGE